MKVAQPLLFFATRHATISNLTPSMLSQKVKAIQLSAGDFYQKIHVFKGLPQQWTFKRFCGLEESIMTYLTPYDFMQNDRIKQSTDTKIVKIKCDNGYVQFDTFKYDQLARVIDPDYLVCLTDYPNQKDTSSQKRAINKTLNYLNTSKYLREKRKSKILLPLHICTDMKNTVDLLQAGLDFGAIDGFVLCNLCQGQDIVERERVYQLIADKIKASGRDYPIGLAGIGKIQDIKHAVQHGLSFFQVSYPFMLAERHKALIQKGQRLLQTIPQLKDELSPLSSDCSCYACQRHNEAYIAHLLACKEPNAAILLTTHNLQVYLDLNYDH